MAATPSSPYSAGRPVYTGARSAPNVGAVSNKSGYRKRDIRQQAQQRALVERNKFYQQKRV
jgi:hypothetical protein